MGWLEDIGKFEGFQLKDWGRKIKESPEQLLLGAGDPFGAKVWGGITGKDYEPFVDQMGGAYGGSTVSAFGKDDGGVYGRAREAGIDTTAGGKMHDLAHVISAYYAAGYGADALGGGGGTGVEGQASVQSGTATPVQTGGGSGSGGWQQWLQRFGGGGGGGMPSGDQGQGQGDSFSKFNEAFQYGYDQEAYTRRKNQDRQFRLQEQEALRRQEAHAYDMDQRRAAAARQAAIARQVAALEAMQAGVSQPAQAQYAQLGYTPEQVATGVGLRGAAGFRDQVARYQNDVDSSDLQSVPEGTVRYNATGLPAPRANANNISTAGPSEADIYGQLGRVALASGDMRGFVESRNMAKDSRFDEAYLAGRDTVMGMDDKALKAELDGMKKTGELPGFGGFVYETDAKGRKSAYMTYKTTAGTELKLDRDELADLAGFREAMRVDPMRARKELSKLKGDSRAMAFELFKAQAEGARVNNNAVEHAASANHRARMLELQAQQYENSRWKPLGATTDGRGLAMVSLDGRFKTVAAPEGVDTRSYFPKQVGRLKLEDNGFYSNERGLPVGRADERYGIVPLQPASTPSKEAAKKLAMHNIQPAVVSADDSGTPSWAWVVPNNNGDGVVAYDNPEEAAMALTTPTTPAQVRRAVNRQGEPVHRLGVPAEDRSRPSIVSGHGFGLRPPKDF